MKRVLTGILAMAMAATLLVGCSGKSSEDNKSVGSTETSTTEAKQLKVGVLAAMTALPIVDAVQTGLAEEKGLDIEFVNFSTGAPMNEAMAAGEIDVSFIGAAAIFSLANNNSKMIGEICTDTVAIDLIARGDSEITKATGANADYPDVLGSAETIKGATILCPAGTLSQFEVQKYLEVFGLTMDDVNFVPMEYAQAYQAFKTGEGDIVATRSPQTFTAVDDEGWVSIADLKKLKADATAQVVASEEAYNNKADALAILMEVVAIENDKLNGDVEYAATLMSEYFKENGQEIDVEVAKKQLSVKPFYGVEDMKQRTFGDDFKNTLLEFYISSDQLEESQREIVAGNVKNDILVKAGLN